jgi:hypothetical protein
LAAVGITAQRASFAACYRLGKGVETGRELLDGTGARAQPNIPKNGHNAVSPSAFMTISAVRRGWLGMDVSASVIDAPPKEFDVCVKARPKSRERT